MILRAEQDVKFLHIKSVAHDGKVVLVATAADGRIFYTIKQCGFEETARTEHEAKKTGWEDWQPLAFPGRYEGEKDRFYAEDPDASVLEKECKEFAVPKGGDEVPVGSLYKSYDASATEPVQLVSALGHLFVFRQSKDGTVLADRFVLDGMSNRLVRKLEVRFKRSKERYRPLKEGSGEAAMIDSLDFKDENDRAFFEPTTQIRLLGGITGGLFSVVCVPTTEHGVSMWHFFAWDDAQKRLQSVSIRSTEDRVFDICDTVDLCPGSASTSGIVRHSFDLSPKTLLAKTPTGLAASHYDVQVERQTKAGPQLLREDSRVMLAVGTVEGTITISFALGADGALSRIATTAEGSGKPLRDDHHEILLPTDTLRNAVPIGSLNPAATGDVLEMRRDEDGLVALKTDNPAGLTKFKTGDLIEVKGTASLDGHYASSTPEDADHFVIDAKDPSHLSPGHWKQIKKDDTSQFRDGDITGVTAIGKLHPNVHAPGHGLTAGEPVQIEGHTGIDGLHEIAKIEAEWVTLRRKWHQGRAINTNAEESKRPGIEFVDASAYLTTPDLAIDDPDAHVQTGSTMSVWVKIPSEKTKNRMLVEQADHSQWIELKDGVVTGCVRTSSGLQTLADPAPATPGRWVHYALTVQSEAEYGLPAKTNAALIKNGVEVASTGDQVGLPETLPILQAETGDVGTENDLTKTSPLDAWITQNASSMAVSGHWAIVGVTSAGDHGKAYLFQRVEGKWVQYQTLEKPGNPDAPDETGFGTCVAIQGTHAVVGVTSGGAVRIYELRSGYWVLQGSIDRVNATSSVAIHEDKLVIGDTLGKWLGMVRGRSAHSHTGSRRVLYTCGEVSIYRHSEKGWTLAADLNPEEKYDGLAFGRAVAIWGDRVLVSSGATGSENGKLHFFGLERSGKATIQGDRTREKTSRDTWVEQRVYGGTRSHPRIGGALSIYEDHVLTNVASAQGDQALWIGRIESKGVSWDGTEVIRWPSRNAHEIPKLDAWNNVNLCHDGACVTLHIPGSDSAGGTPATVACLEFKDQTLKLLSQVAATGPAQSGANIDDSLVDQGHALHLFDMPAEDIAEGDTPVEVKRIARSTVFHGARQPGGTEHTAGAIVLAELQVWNRARPADEIRETMHLVMAGGDPDLVGYWRLGGLVPGDPRVAVDFSHSGKDAQIFGKAFVTAAALPRNLKTLVNGVPAIALEYRNDAMFAVSQNTKYFERFEFRYDSGKQPSATPFRCRYWGKRNHAAVGFVPEDPAEGDAKFYVSPTTIGEATKDGWYPVECSFRTDKDVTLMRSFGLAEIDQTGADWDAIEVRNHSITASTNSITEDHYIDKIEAKTIGDDAKAVKALIELEALEKESGALWTEKQRIEVALNHPSKFAEQIKVLEQAVRDDTADVKTAQAALKAAKVEVENSLKQARLYYNDNFSPSAPNKSYGCNVGTLEFHGTGWDDITTSVRVPDGLVVTLYQSKDFGGRTLELRADDPNVGNGKDAHGKNKDFNDRTTCVRVTTVGGHTSRATAAADRDTAQHELDKAKRELDKAITALDRLRAQAQHTDAELRARLTEINAELRNLDSQISKKNKTVLDGVVQVWDTPLAMAQVGDDHGLKTYAARLGSARAKSNLSVLGTCQGTLQFSYLDTNNRVRHTSFDPVADSDNSISEQWLPDGLRACINFKTETGTLRLKKLIKLDHDWTIDAWVLFPLTGRQVKDWTPAPYTSCVVGAADGSNALVQARFDPNTATAILGSCARDGSKGSFQSSGFDLSRLDAGWHHVALSSTDGVRQFYVDGKPAGDAIGKPAEHNDLPAFQLDTIGHVPGHEPIGKLAEFKIWDVALEPADIESVGLALATGHEPGLMLYLPMQEAGGTDLRDASGHGYNAILSGNEWSGCAAPIGQRDGQDHGLTCFEYSDIAHGAGGKHALMRRGYAFAGARGIDLPPDRVIEELDLVWIGNCQFDPTLLGYIEGAPPVPSENLTAKSNYAGASSVTLTQSHDVGYSWDRSENGGGGASGEFFLGAQDVKTTGMMVTSRLESHERGIIGKIDTNYSEVAKSHVASSSSTKETDGLSLRGTQEQVAKFPHLGKRFIPKNVGYALVISGLADVFVSRLRRSGRMVAYQTVPVKDVPPDVNTITFLINPAYTMAGSLDGMTGSQATSERFFGHVPQMRAQMGSKYPASFMRLREAYDLKQQIDRQDKQRASYFQNFQAHYVDMAGVGRQVHGGKALGTVEVTREVDKKPVDPNQTKAQKDAADKAHLDQIKAKAAASSSQNKEQAKEKQAEIQRQIDARKGRDNASTGFAYWQNNMDAIQARSGKRNIVNNYVWDADGGMHVESQNFANSMRHSIGGSFSMKGGLGMTGKFFFGGLGSKLTGSANFKLEQVMTKTENHTEGFALNVSVTGVESSGITDHDDTPLMPGEKVDRYRFLSFFLDGSTKNFSDFFDYVVDPEWLASNDEEARALRQAQGKANETWRVMHRVTYVERPALKGFGRDLRVLDTGGAVSVEKRLDDLTKKIADLRKVLKK